MVSTTLGKGTDILWKRMYCASKTLYTDLYIMNTVYPTASLQHT